MKKTRREFLAASLVSGAALSVAAPLSAAAPKRPPICVFSKHLQFLDYKALAKTCREIGLDGVDLTVRPKGHVEPRDVAKSLPAAVEAIRAEGLETPMITTRLTDGDDPTARPILSTAAKLGIKYFRVGGQKYAREGDPLAQLARFTEGIKRLAKVAAEYGMTAGYHNHSGAWNVGGPLWDLLRMIQAVDSPHFGSNFDVGHATAEGAYGAWRVNARVMAPRVKMMAVKDFVHGETGRVKWVPLGEGIVETVEFLKVMRAAGFAGPISIHIEYKVADGAAMIEEARKSAVVLRKCLEQAGY